MIGSADMHIHVKMIYTLDMDMTYTYSILQCVLK